MSIVAGSEMLRVDEGVVRSHVDEVVRSSVEQTLNGLLDPEANRRCGASRYERSADRLDTRAGSCERELQRSCPEYLAQIWNKVAHVAAIQSRYDHFVLPQ